MPFTPPRFMAPQTIITPHVSLCHLGKFYGRKPVLRDISHEFSGITLITGANGAGKSTLLRIIAGLSCPDLGTVNISGKVGYLGHATFLYPGLTARENLAFWARALGIVNLDLDKLLERVGLEKSTRERVRVFSRGMAQRLNLARLLMAEPEILLLDEPSTGLDAQSRQFLHNEIISAKNNGACTLLVSHDPGDISLADKVLAIRKGRLEEA